MTRSPASRPAPPEWVARELEMGFAALNDRRLDAAAHHCKTVLGSYPDLVPGHFLVGLVALEKRDSTTALNAFGSVTRLDPTHGAAWAQLARLFMLGGQAGRADAAIEQAVRHERGDPVVQDLIGTIFSMLGDQPGACGWYRKAVAGDPSQPGYRVNLANSLVFLGRTTDAVRELEHVIATHPASVQAHWLLASARQVRDRAHIETLVRLIARGRWPAQALAFLYYALGKELEDLAEWPRAFEAFARGAAARRRTIRYDESAEIAAFEAAATTYTRTWLDRGGAGAADDGPIFVVGQPRTGTTLVERIITSHSMVHSAGELQQFSLSVRRLVGEALPGRFNAALLARAASLEPRDLGDAYLRATRVMRGDTPRFVDKLPTNYLYLPLILKALPNARVVHLVRNPMDACFASFKQLFADAYPHSYDQQEMARHFARYHRLMAVWRDRFKDRFLDVTYEDLVADVEPHARALIDHLRLPWEDACLSFHAQTGAVATASAAQVREPAHTRSVDRWRRYEVQLAPTARVLRSAGVIDT